LPPIETVTDARCESVIGIDAVSSHPSCGCGYSVGGGVPSTICGARR
jgi:hypothetical protein